MLIDGKQIADTILQDLQQNVSQLKQNGITPTLAVILVGDDAGSASYVKQKEKAAEKIGATVLVNHQSSDVSFRTVQQLIHDYNQNPNIHGIIIQLPLPSHFDISIHESVNPEKDVDGFAINSAFEVPVAMAVEKILLKMYELKNRKHEEEFYSWLKQQQIVIIGRGETAGKPIANHLTQSGCNVSIIHTHTQEEEKQQLVKTADIIISCVGKQHVIQGDMLKKGCMLISVGIWRDEKRTLHGDYEKEDIESIASFYTPTPGGVGPVNVACLMGNLITAASNIPTKE